MDGRSYYALCMALSLAAFLIARRFVPRVPALERTPWWKRLGLLLAAFVGGAVGAKLPFVLSGEAPWLSPGAWLSDGKTVTTAILGGYVAIEIAKPLLGVHAKTGDTFAFPMAVGLAVGRLGCFLNGCCAGVATDLPWGVDFGDGVRRHPTQVYEILFHLTMAVVLWRLTTAGRLRYQLLKFYLICYGAFRFLTEFLRPAEPVWLDLTFYQWVSVVLILFLAAQWRLDERLKSREVRLAAG